MTATFRPRGHLVAATLACVCLWCLRCDGALTSNGRDGGSGQDGEDQVGGSATSYDHYYIEHEVTQTFAKQAARNLSDIQEAAAPGCKSCSSEEIRYCLTMVINDHCCCDKKYNEAIPYVVHSCYQGVTPCTPQAESCADYFRLMRCCCSSLLQHKWKQKAMSTGSRHGIPAAVWLLSMANAFQRRFY